MQTKCFEKTKPLVSIIVPVYNAERYLHKCMDSLVNQTFKDIEIVTIDDGSTDNSLLILEDYKKRYPDKIVVLSIQHVEGAGAGAPRNKGIEIARGKYICFCDSDDEMDNRAIELLYFKAVEGGFDIVCAPAWHITGNNKVLYGELKEPITTEELILNGQVYLWGKLFKRGIINKAGKMPEFCYEDLGYSPVLHSYAQKIGYIDYPVYYYYKRFGSDSNTIFAHRNLDRIRAREYAKEKCNQEYRQYVMAFVARSINVDIRKRWIFADRFIQELKELWKEFNNNTILKSDEYLFSRLQKFVNLNDVTIPRNLFIGGFGETLPDNLEEIKEKAFYDGCNLVVLNEENCDINEKEIIKRAYEASEFEFVNGYFALKAIVKHGGIYMDKRINIDAPFNYVRYCQAFFTLLDEHTYSDWILGGVNGHLRIPIFGHEKPALWQYTKGSLVTIFFVSLFR